MGLHAVLLQTGVETQLMAGVVEHLPDRDLQGVPVPAVDLPERGERLGGQAGRVRVGSDRLGDPAGWGSSSSAAYARSSAWIETDLSALTRMSRVAIGRWAVSRPA